MKKILLAVVIAWFGVSLSQTAFAKDRDNNSPGPTGGPGTNWENPPGPQGGPGASPNFRRLYRGNNPPGPMGGPGTNWENPPGPMGGPGASSNQPPFGEQGFDQWFESHPELKQKMDLNGDGTVDQTERDQAREKFQEKKKAWIEEHSEMKKKLDANGDGVIDQAERKAAHEAWQEAHPMRQDFNSNPPGAMGGPGTNWENPPGPQGGPGMGPGFGRDRDNNPPGLRGGPGTNWENPPGPRGGRGASPNRKRR